MHTHAPLQHVLKNLKEKYCILEKYVTAL
jgi:hypothetical protein